MGLAHLMCAWRHVEQSVGRVGRRGFGILLVHLTWWRLWHGIGVRRDQGRGIGGHVDLMVLAWWGGMDLWDVCVFSAWIG